MERKYYIDFAKKKLLPDGSIEYNGYLFHKDGYIINPNGRRITITAKTGRMRFRLPEGKLIIVKAARLAYEIYHNVNLNRGELVKCLDGDLTNIAMENLELLERKEYFKDFNWIYKFDEDTVQKIIKEYKKGGISIQGLADKYGCCHATIWNITHGNYKGTKKE